MKLIRIPMHWEDTLLLVKSGGGDFYTSDWSIKTVDQAIEECKRNGVMYNRHIGAEWWPIFYGGIGIIYNKEITGFITQGNKNEFQIASSMCTITIMEIPVMVARGWKVVML